MSSTLGEIENPNGDDDDGSTAIEIGGISLNENGLLLILLVCFGSCVIMCLGIICVCVCRIRNKNNQTFEMEIQRIRKSGGTFVDADDGDRVEDRNRADNLHIGVPTDHDGMKKHGEFTSVGADSPTGSDIGIDIEDAFGEIAIARPTEEGTGEVTSNDQASQKTTGQEAAQAILDDDNENDDNNTDNKKEQVAKFVEKEIMAHENTKTNQENNESVNSSDNNKDE